MSRRSAAWLVGAAVALMPPGMAGPSVATRVRGFNPLHRAAVERALAGATRRLDRSECRRIFEEFHDGSGAPLQARLDALGVDAADYMSLIVFTDGAARSTCHRSDVLAVTAPGSRVVFVCGRVFARAEALSAGRAEIVLLHEALHTLGLGENPPDSLEITRRVRDRCPG